jgi:hypothetical protein
MQQYAGQWRIKEMVEILDVSRSGYYCYCKKKISQQQQTNERLLGMKNKYIITVVGPMVVLGYKLN